MGWMLLGVLGVAWVSFLYPAHRISPNRTIEDFERNMDLLADTENGGQGRWIVTPRKGMAFVGVKERAKERARERRRRVFVVLLESIALTALIGLVPPLRAMWYATGILFVFLGVYVWMLVTLKARASDGVRMVRPVGAGAAPTPTRFVAGDGGRTPRPALGGLAAIGADDLVNVVVRGGGEVGVARV